MRKFDESIVTFNNTQSSSKKIVPTGQFKVKITEITAAKSKAGFNTLRWAGEILEVLSIDDDALENDAYEHEAKNIVGRRLTSTNSINIKSDKQDFVTKRWGKFASLVLPLDKIKDMYESNDNDTDYLYDLTLALQKHFAKGNTLDVTVNRKVNGEYWNNDIILE